MPPTRPRPADRRAFTLLEVVVVVTMLALLAAVAIPRLSGTRRTAFDHFVDEVSDMLLLFAQRDNLGRSPIGLVLDVSGERPALQLMVMAEADQGRGAWVIDRLVAPVELPDFIAPADLEIEADGESIEIRDRVLAQVPGEDRPTITIRISDVDRRHRATLELTPHGVAARRLDDRRAATARRPVDLDAEGRSREDW